MPKISKRINYTISCLKCSAAFIIVSHAQTVLAQGGTPVEGGSASAVAGEADAGLTDIIVTAQRREENAQRAAIAISVVSSEAVSRVTDPQELTRLAPSLQIGSTGGNAPALYVRGVGTFTANANTDPAVAINYDGVYLARPTSTFGLFYDLDRLEVLKGPQGTLYGRNATGGALNIIPAKPRIGEHAMSGTLSVGNYDSINAQAAVNLPISDKAALRVAGATYTHDGYNSDGTYSEKGTGGRAQLLVKPSDDLSIRISGDYFKLGGTGVTGVLTGITDPISGQNTAVTQGASVGAYDPRTVAIFNQTLALPAATAYGPLPVRPKLDGEFYGLMGEANANLGFADLTVLASYRRSQGDDILQPASFTARVKQKEDQVSIETRLAGKAGSLDWLAGGYYFNEDIDSEYIVNVNYLGSPQIFTGTNRSYAGFGRLTWHFADNFRLTGAARYSKDKKIFDGQAQNAVAICTVSTGCPGVRPLPSDLRDLPAALNSIGFVEAAPGSPVYVDTQGSGAFYQLSTTTVVGNMVTDKLTYRGAVEFDIRPATLLYASVETGYRSGGFAFSSVKPEYKPENIIAYTIGAKNRFFGNKLQLNIEGFVWKYKDQQVSHSITGANGTEFITENIGRSTNKGVEVEMVAKPLRNTLLTADVQYLDAKNDSFVYREPDSGAPPASACPSERDTASNTYIIDCSGLRALRSPKWSINLGGQQVMELNDALKLTLEASSHYQSSNIVMFERRAFGTQKAYWIADASVSLGSQDDQWSIAAFVNNIGDRRVITNAVYNSINGLTTASYNAPRTYGLRLSFRN